MTKKIIYSLLLTAAMSSCSTDDLGKLFADGDGANVNVRMAVKPFVEIKVDGDGRQTRVAYDTEYQDNTSLYSCRWSDGDEFQIYPYGSSTGVKATISVDGDHYTQNKDGKDWFGAKFTANGLGFSSGNRYVAQYPLPRSASYQGYSFINPSFSLLTQVGNDNNAHLAEHDYMVSSVSTINVSPDGKSGDMDFYFEHLCTILKFNLYGLQEGLEFTRFSLNFKDQGFEEDGTQINMNMNRGNFYFKWGDDDKISEVTRQEGDYYSSDVLLDLKATEDSNDGITPVEPTNPLYKQYGNVITVYVMVAPGNYDGMRDDGFRIRLTYKDPETGYDRYYGGVTRGVKAKAGYQYTMDMVLEKEEFEPSAGENGYVDLGLPSGTKWATANLGASIPSGAGNYYAWGERSAKDEYTPYNYKYVDVESGKLTKYYTSDEYGDAPDNLTKLTSMDEPILITDINIHLPSRNQIRELIETCKWTEMVYNGTIGSLVTGPNGNNIFLPYTGYKAGSVIYDNSRGGYYWGSSLRGFSDYDDEQAGCLRISGSGKHNNYNGARYLGYTVRTVMGDEPGITNEYVADKLEEQETVKEGSYEYVDLGLPSGLKWCTKYIGASNEYSSGSTFAWGETTSKSIYRYYNYALSNKEQTVSKYRYTKYTVTVPGFTGSQASSYNRHSPTKDNKMVLEPIDDAATQRCGSGWRMPTREEVIELIENCNIYKIPNGCYACVGPNGNMIVFAKTKFIYEDIMYGDANDNDYNYDYRFWTSSMYNNQMGSSGWKSVYADASNKAYLASISSTNHEWPAYDGYAYRYDGYGVRPVHE